MYIKSCSKLVLDVLLFSLGLFQYLYAQGPDTLWTKTYGGANNDFGFSVQQTLDGGYIISGYTQSFGAGGQDVWLIKTDASGDSTWSKTFGGSDDDYGYSVQQTADSGYIITGATQSFGAGGQDVWLIKTNTSGDTTWTKSFGSIDNDVGNCVQQTSDGGYIITGYIFSSGPSVHDVWLIKTNTSGDTTWTKSFGGSATDGGISVQQTADSGYIVLGSTKSFGAGKDDIWLIKTNASGDTTWTKTFGGSAVDWGGCVQQTTEGGYIISGYTFSLGSGSNDVWLIKTNASGDTTWTKTFGGSVLDWGISVQQTADGGYIITGMTESFGAGGQDVWFIKTDASGDSTWSKTFGGSDDDYGYSAQQTTDSGYIITGATESFGAGDGDVWLIKTGPEQGVVEHDGQSNISGNCVLKQNYPNPFNTSTDISYSISHSDFVSLSVCDVLGRKVKPLVSGFKRAGKHSVTFDATKLSSGVYYCTLKIGNDSVRTKKMLLLR